MHSAGIQVRVAAHAVLMGLFFLLNTSHMVFAD